MSRISQFSDHVPTRRGISRSDLEKGLMLVLKEDVILYDGKKYKEVEQKLQEEMANGCPRPGYVARCQEIMQRLYPNYQKYLDLQKSGIIR